MVNQVGHIELSSFDIDPETSDKIIEEIPQTERKNKSLLNTLTM